MLLLSRLKNKLYDILHVSISHHLYSAESMKELSQYCDEFLVHAVDVEGKKCGIQEDLVVLCGECSPLPVTYAGGVHALDDLDRVRHLGQNKVNSLIFCCRCVLVALYLFYVGSFIDWECIGSFWWTFTLSLCCTMASTINGC